MDCYTNHENLPSEKFLINSKGDAVARFKSSIEPDSIEIQKAIEVLLN